ncbi:MAG: hypothetical protein Q9169_008662 [Polycauliona sp. 2 TL-2023]
MDCGYDSGLDDDGDGDIMNWEDGDSGYASNDDPMIDSPGFESFDYMETDEQHDSYDCMDTEDDIGGLFGVADQQNPLEELRLAFYGQQHQQSFTQPQFVQQHQYQQSQYQQPQYQQPQYQQPQYQPSKASVFPRAPTQTHQSSIQQQQPTQSQLLPSSALIPRSSVIHFELNPGCASPCQPNVPLFARSTVTEGESSTPPVPEAEANSAQKLADVKARVAKHKQAAADLKNDIKAKIAGVGRSNNTGGRGRDTHHSHPRNRR